MSMKRKTRKYLALASVVVIAVAVYARAVPSMLQSDCPMFQFAGASVAVVYVAFILLMIAQAVRGDE